MGARADQQNAAKRATTTTTREDAEALIDTVGHIAPIVREHAAQAERQCRLSHAVVDAIRDAGLYRMFTPRSLGGLEMDPLAVFRIIESLSAIDSAAGWNVAASLAVIRFVAALPDETPETFFADSPDTVFAATLFPVGKAAPVDGGYRVTAQGRFGSGSDQARWIMMLGALEATDPPVGIGAFFSPEEVVNRRNWHSLGMRGTGSHDIDASDVFVPRSRAVPLQSGLAPGRHFQGPLYQLPYIAHTAAVVAPVAIGIARSAIDGLLALVEIEGAATAGRPLKERARLHSLLGEAKAAVDSARALEVQVIQDAWDTVVAAHTVTLRQRGDLQLAQANAAARSFEAVERVMRAAGTSGISPSHSLERHFRDIATLRQHAIFSEGRFETAGRLYLGLMPEDYPAAIL